MTTFSVILATRNRPQLFCRALQSVLDQSCGEMEIIVVNDGSDDEHEGEYREIIEQATRPIQFHSLLQRRNGHGQSYALNFGAAKARGEYLCFLDDDDEWTDFEYLRRAGTTLQAERPDLHFSNQSAYLHDQRKPGPIWIEDVADLLMRSGRNALPGGAYSVSLDDLLRSSGFCHLNTMIVRRSLFLGVGGMDEGIRWECDHDIYLRLVDRAQTMLYAPDCVSRHNIPDPAKTLSMTTALGELERRLYQLRVFDKAALFASHSAIRDLGRKQKGYTLKRIAETLVAQQQYAAALCYAREAFGVSPTLKWAAYTVYVTLARLARPAPAGRAAQAPNAVQTRT
jgi:glycosyltransferase involved in cell wall biosynthesis